MHILHMLIILSLLLKRLSHSSARADNIRINTYFNFIVAWITHDDFDAAGVILFVSMPPSHSVTVYFLDCCPSLISPK